MKRILVATDFSPAARRALEAALARFPSAQRFKVTLLNAYLVQETDPQLVLEANDRMKQRSREGLEREKAWLQEKGLAAETLSQMGSLPNVLGRLLEREKPDLVAMGLGPDVGSVEGLLEKRGIPLVIAFAP